MRRWSGLSVMALVACGSPASDLRRPLFESDTGTPDSGDADTDVDSDADADTDVDSDSDTDSGDSGEEPVDTGEDVPAPLYGIDVSHWNGSIDWQAAEDDGISFVFMKATEGDYYNDTEFDSNWAGAGAVGMWRGAYHFATPDVTSGADQADFFIDGGGGWDDDGKTLPGVLDFEWNPYGDDCYDMTSEELAAWILDFDEQYYARTGRWPVIYTSKTYWNYCVNDDLSDTNTLWVANWNVENPSIPYGWDDWVFWQYSAEGVVDGIPGEVDVNAYNGGSNDLWHYAKGN